MRGDLEALWNRLEEEAGLRADPGVVRLRLTRDADDGLYVAVDAATKGRMLLVETRDPEKIVHALPRWREVGVRAVRDPVSPGQGFVGLELVNPSYRDVFVEVAWDLYRVLAPLRRGPGVPRMLAERLSKWQRFFREYGAQGLDEEAQRGLFGELWFLSQVVLPHLAPVEAVRPWKGPERAPHDFRFGNGAVEVKVTSSRDPDRVRISNERQLDDAGVPTLYLWVLNLIPGEEAGGRSLPALVADVSSTLIGDDTAVAMFAEKLLHSGYLTVHEPEYVKVYQTSSESLYRVTEGFPRLIQPPNGVVRVRYEISLQTCQTFRVDPRPALSSVMEMETAR